MISWAIPAPAIVTGYTSSLYSESATFSASSTGSFLPSGTTTYENTSSSTYYDFRYTSAGEYGVTLYTSSSSSYAEFVNANGTTTQLSESGPENSSAIVSSVTSEGASNFTYTTTNSTFVTLTLGATSLSSYTTTGFSSTAWTTVYDEEQDSTFFDLDENAVPTFWQADSTTGFVDSVITVQDTRTTRARNLATVWEANTNYALTSFGKQPEVIYQMSVRPTTYEGHLPATQFAQSHTRITQSQLFSTRGANVIGRPTASSSFSTVNASVGLSSSIAARTTTATTETVVNTNILPNSTSSRTATRYTTTAQNLATTLFTQNTVSWTAVAQTNITSAATTTTVVSHNTGFSVVLGQDADLGYESTVSGVYYQTRTITTSVAYSRTLTSSSTASNSTSGRTQQWGSTSNITANETCFGPNQVSVETNTNLTDTITREAYRTQGAIINDETGGWITGIGDTTSGDLTRFIASAKRGGQTLIEGPDFANFYTVSGNTVSWPGSTISGTTTARTTRSFVASVSGDPATTQETFTQTRPTLFGGGPFAEGVTIVQGARPGAYVDLIDGSTTSFSGGATALVGSQSEQIRSWWPLVYLAPFELNSRRDLPTWTEFRNDNPLAPRPIGVPNA
jgi:hypothetical protein